MNDDYVSDARIKPLFAPDHIPEMEFIKQMNKARHNIDFAIFTFSKPSGIDGVMGRRELIKNGERATY